MDGFSSRRRFLAHAAVFAAGPFALSGCWRRSKSADRPAEATNLDDVEDAATFRPPIPSIEPSVRVRVLKVRESGEAGALRIGDDGRWLRVHDEHSPGKGLALNGPIDVMMTASGWSITDAKGFRGSVDAKGTIEIAPLDGDASMLTTVRARLQGASAKAPPVYPGSLRLISRHDLDEIDSATGVSAARGWYDVINHVPVELYLPGVLAGELYASWQLETYAAQAVAARSFACTEVAVFAGRRHYDLTNTAASQMYIGGNAHKRAQEAVALTRGLVLGYDGLLVSGYYSSCCGGVAASAIDAIGSNPVNNAPPLHGRSGADVCTESSVFRWSVDQPIELLTRRLVAFGQERRMKDLAGMTPLASIDVIATNAHGRPTRMRVIDDRDVAVELTAENFRRAANYSGQGLNPPEKPLKSAFLQASFSSTTVSFEGFGFGHGVGLCQYGSEALAKGGMKHREILEWYYPGAEHVPAYG